MNLDHEDEVTLILLASEESTSTGIPFSSSMTAAEDLTSFWDGVDCVGKDFERVKSAFGRRRRCDVGRSYLRSQALHDSEVHIASRARESHLMRQKTTSPRAKSTAQALKAALLGHLIWASRLRPS